MNNIARFDKLENNNGLITLTIDGDNIDFHIDELRDFMYENNTNIDENDTIVDIKIDTYTSKNGNLVDVPCIKMKTQDNYEEVIFQDDEFFFVDFLEFKLK